jgi:hypothetical protein
VIWGSGIAGISGKIGRVYANGVKRLLPQSLSIMLENQIC